MKKITFLLFAILAISCSDDDAMRTTSMTNPLLGVWHSTIATLSDGTSVELINCSDPLVAQYKMYYDFDINNNCGYSLLCEQNPSFYHQEYHLSGNTLTVSDVTAPFDSEEYELTFVDENTIIARKQVTATDYIDITFEKSED